MESLSPGKTAAGLKAAIVGFLEGPGWLSRLGFGLWWRLNRVRAWLSPPGRQAAAAARAFDREFGVETGGWISLWTLRIDSRDLGQGLHYEGVGVTAFHEAMDRIGAPLDGFTFVDLGSGKGRALLLAAGYPFEAIQGVEFSSDLHAIAEGNIRQYRERTGSTRSIESLRGDAAEFPVPTGRTVFHLFNPFGAAVLGTVLDNIRGSLRQAPREAYVVYINPLQADAVDWRGFEVLARTDRLAVFRWAFTDAQSR